MADFKQCLTNTIGSYKIPADVCKTINLDNHSRIIRSSGLRRLLFKLNAWLLAVLADFNRVPLTGPPTSSTRRLSRLTFRQKLALVSGGLFDSRKKWPTMVLFVYLVAILEHVIVTWFQYIQDANLIKLQRMEARLSMTGERQRLIEGANLDVDKLRHQFSDRILESRQMLELIGNPLSDWQFVLEPINVIALQTIEWLVWTPIRCQLHKWNVLAAKMIIDENDETEERVRMVLAEEERFKRDSLLFARSRLMRLERDLKLVADDPDQKSLLEISRGKRIGMIIKEMLQEEQRRLDKNHATDLRRFKLVALRGRLNPLNRTPAFKDKLALLCILVLVSYELYTHGIMCLIVYKFNEYFTSHPSGAPAMQVAGLKRLLGIIWHVIVVEIAALSATFYLAIIACAITDHVELIKQVQALFVAVVRMNWHRFEELIAIDVSERLTKFSKLAYTKQLKVHSSRRRDELSQAIQLDLIMLVAQFRLAVASFEQSREAMQQIVFATLLFALSIPFVWLFHCPYLNEDLRLIVLGNCCSVALCCLVFLTPVALLYHHHASLVKSSWTLVAQLTHYEALPDVNKHLHLNNNVALFIFRRLLFDPKMIVERLLVYVFAMPVTYANLIRVFTYCAIFMIASGFVTLSLFGDVLASFMMDPFRLFKFLRIE